MPGFRHIAVLLAASCLAALSAGAAIAQDLVPEGYRAYQLKQAWAQELAPRVRTLVNTSDPAAEVVVDRQMNRILVKGSDAAQRLAAQLIETLDRPAATAAREVKPPKVAGYSVPAQSLDATVAALEADYPPQTGVGITADPRTGQIIIIAPEEVHRAIEARLAAAARSDRGAVAQEGGPAIEPEQDERLAAALDRAQPVSRESRSTILLRNARWSDLEDHLRRAWGDRVHWSTDQAGETSTARFPTSSGKATEISVDRRNNLVTIEGTADAVAAWQRVLQAIDSRERRNESTQLHPLRRADPRQVQQVVEWLNASSQRADNADKQILATLRLDQPRSGSGMVSRIFQPEDREHGVRVAQVDGNQNLQPPANGQGNQFPPPDGNQPEGNQQGPVPGGPLGPTEAAALLQGAGLIGNVQITIIEELDLILIRGRPSDVDAVIRIIEQIEAQSALTRPIVEIYPLRHVDGQALNELLIQIYGDVLSARQGQVTIIPLVKPNSLLLIGRRESVDAVIDLVRRLDTPVAPRTRFRVFSLEYMSATDAEQRLTTFYTNQGVGLGPRVLMVSDYRSNKLIVQGSERDLEEVAEILKAIDTVDDTGAINEIRVFRLTNTLAVELQPVLQDALNGQLQGAGRGSTTGTGGIGQQAIAQVPGGAAGVAGATGAQIRSAALSFLAREGLLLRSGLMFDVRITALNNANALIVVAPSKSMELIAAVIEQLDQLPDAESQIMVYPIVNGDATTLANTLQQIFGQQAGGAQGLAQAALLQAAFQSAAGTGESSLVALRFAVDVRTNSIIATGSKSDLRVVETILVRLDEAGVGQRQTTVFRLKNAPATAVAAAITDLLTQQRAINTADPTLVSPFQQIEREVIVVPEIVSNSLIVSATPRFYKEVVEIVEKLDARPPMVMIQVIIAEVTLDDTEEFGVEMGVQDSLVFDRGIGVVGFPFNTALLGNNSDAVSLATRETLAGQALQNLSLGRTNARLGYGGMVLSAGNESINILIRALQDKRRLQVLSRPQVMTLDNQPAFVQVGARVPYITSTQVTETGTINSTTLENVGLILGVTPRTSPDGLVVMEIDAEKSEVGPEAEGIPISINQNGDVIRSPQINITTAQTTISARSGQTVVFAGLITKSRSRVSHRIPIASDMPVIGRIFRFDSEVESRSELLIIMTPYVVREDHDADVLKHMESSRMSWALADLVEFHGDAGLSPGHGLWGEGEPPAIFPKTDPLTATWRFFMGTGVPETVVPPIVAPVRLWHDSPLPDLLDPFDLRYQLWPWKPLAEPRGPVLNRNREEPYYAPGPADFQAATSGYEILPGAPMNDGNLPNLPAPAPRYGFPRDQPTPYESPPSETPRYSLPQGLAPENGSPQGQPPQPRSSGTNQGASSTVPPVLIAPPAGTGLTNNSSRREAQPSASVYSAGGGNAVSTAQYVDDAVLGAAAQQGAAGGAAIVTRRLFDDRGYTVEEVTP